MRGVCVASRFRSALCRVCVSCVYGTGPLYVVCLSSDESERYLSSDDIRQTHCDSNSKLRFRLHIIITFFTWHFMIYVRICGVYRNVGRGCPSIQLIVHVHAHLCVKQGPIRAAAHPRIRDTLAGLAATGSASDCTTSC